MAEQVSLSDIAQLELRDDNQLESSQQDQTGKPGAANRATDVGGTILAGVDNSEFNMEDEDDTHQPSTATVNAEVNSDTLDAYRNTSPPTHTSLPFDGKSSPTLRGALVQSKPDFFKNGKSFSGLPSTGVPGLVDTTTVNPRQLKTSTKAENICQIFSVFFALVVRAALASLCLVGVYMVVERKHDTRYWALAAALVFLLIETINIIVTRKGQERKWIAMCFVCYLLAGLPPIWLLELDSIGKNNTNCGGDSENLSFDLDAVSKSDEAKDILENCFVFLLILCRWLLPRGEITHDQLSQLLFVFIGTGSDTTELFQLFDSTKVANNTSLKYVILAIWSFSLFQFTLVLTMSVSPKKARIARDVKRDAMDDGRRASTNQRGLRSRDSTKRPRGKRRNKIKHFFAGTEVWSLLISIIMQDGPYFAVRLYVVIVHDIINSNILFFLLKNTLVILFLTYRLIVVALTMSEEKEEEEDGEIKYDDHSSWGDEGHMTFGGRSTATEFSTLASRSSIKSEKC